MSRLMEMFSLFLLVAPISCHRLITAPDPPSAENNAWDSVVVSSDPIKITNNKYNLKNGTASAKKPDYAIRFDPSKAPEERKDSEGAATEDRSFKDCKHNDIKCLYDSEVSSDSSNSKNQEIINKFLEQYSSITNVKFNQDELLNKTDEVKSNSEQKKSYWNLMNSEKHNHPYDDKKGWVTLEPVPWSTSKVSKWQPNVQPNDPPPPQYYPTNQIQVTDSKPWNYGPASQQRPTSTSLWVSNRPTAQPTSAYPSYSKPSSPYSTYRPASQWQIGTNDIITDNKPSDFPVGNGGYSPYPKPDYHGNNHYNERPSGYYENSHFGSGGYPGQKPQRYPTATGHPPSYPDEGNGEWVLLSTTKGYSLPQRYRDSAKNLEYDAKTDEAGLEPVVVGRNMRFPEISKYHEENIDEKYVLVTKNADVNRKSGESVENIENVGQLSVNDMNSGNSTWNMDGLRVLHTENGGSILAAAKETGRSGKTNWKGEQSPLHVLHSGKKLDGPPAITYKRTVRLTVLPPVGNTSTTSHGGLLEVDKNQQSMEEAAQLEEEKLKKLSEIANVRQNHLGKYHLVPVSVPRNMHNGLGHRSASILAAVGAGMIPATMAVLVPMALGRRRRSLEDHSGEKFRRYIRPTNRKIKQILAL